MPRGGNRRSLETLTERDADLGRLLLDVMRGDQSLFLRDDELAASWDVVTPVLHRLEDSKVKPQHYAFGSGGP